MSGTPQPIRLKWEGANYVLAVLTHLEEEFFVGAHEGHAQGRVEATRGFVGEQPYQRALMAFLDMQAAGEFSFGSNLSLRWLFKPEGRATYFEILMKKSAAGPVADRGDEPPPREALVRAVRRNDPVLADAFQKVLRRDFFEYWASTPAGMAETAAAGTSGPSAPTATT